MKLIKVIVVSLTMMFGAAQAQNLRPEYPTGAPERNP